MPNSRRECMCSSSFGKHRHVQMDDLLAKLRQNVVELILQGDAVARQMWQMYSLFGEIFGKQSGPTKAIDKKPLSKLSAASRRKSSSSSSSSSNGSSRGKPVAEYGFIEHSKCPPKRSPLSSSSFPDSSRPEIPHLKSRRALQEKTSSLNPLIDTIGSLASDPTNTDDSDLDITFSELKLRQRDPHRNSQVSQTHLASSDRDSTAGYAGSNSVDSGYKSLCTTPEVMDSLAASEVVRSSSTTSDDNMESTLAQRRRTRRPRISQKRESSGSRIGSAVLRKHTNRHRCEHLPTPVANCETDLNQIMYLDQPVPSRTSRQNSGNGRKTKDTRQGINYYSSARSKRHATTSGWPLEKEESTRDIHPHSDTEFYMNEPTELLSADYGVISKKKKTPRNGSEGKNGEPASLKSDSAQKPRTRNRQHSYGFPKRDPEPELGSTTDNTRIRLTEAAMHVLHMIEDFQVDSEAAEDRAPQGMRNHVIGHVIASNVSRVASIQYHSPVASGHVVGSEFHAVATLPCNNATTSADLHIYEEIVYDLIEDSSLPPPPPPPVMSNRMRRETRIVGDFSQDPMRPGGDPRRVKKSSRSSASYTSS